MMGSTGELIVPDGRATRILRFAHDGSLLGEIQGGSLKLGLLGAVALDRDGNVLIYDPTSDSMTVFSEPRFRVLRRFRIAAPIADMVVVSDGSLAIYHPEDEAGAFARFTAAGRRLGAVHPIRDQKLRIFHGRVQNGGIAQDPSGDLFGIEPSTFQLLRFSEDLKVQEMLRGGLDTLWSPDARPFPRHLNPNDYTPAHEEWWDSFMHIGRPYAIGSGMVLVTLFSSRGMSIAREFANVYRTDGRVLAQGLRVPHNGHIVGATDGRVYVVRNAHLVGDTAIAPLELYEYTMRGALAATEYADRRTTQSPYH